MSTIAPGGDVEIQIGVVDHVQPPEQRHRVKRHVLEVNGQVQQRDGQNHFEPVGPGQMLQQPPAAFLRRQRDAHRAQRQEQASRDAVEHDEAKVAGPANRTAERSAAARGPCLADHEQR
jgi:hypothetical protein